MYFIIFSYIFLNLEKKDLKKFAGLKKSSTFAPANRKFGTLPERLGIGLQNRGRRFESARYLSKAA